MNTLPKKHKISYRKYSLTVKLLVFKYQRQNISVFIALISAVTGREVTFAVMTTVLPAWT